MATIYTRKGQPILCDDADYEWLNRYRWSLAEGYAHGYVDGRLITMHRLLVPTEPGQVVDHINRNRADNRRSNLRPATRSENARNTYPQGSITFDRPTGKWWFTRSGELIGMYDDLFTAKSAKREARLGKIPKVTNTTIPID